MTTESGTTPADQKAPEQPPKTETKPAAKRTRRTRGETKPAPAETELDEDLRTALVDASRFYVPDGMGLADHFRRYHVITDAHLAACVAMLAPEAVQDAPKERSGKSYDATGYGYQWVADRLSATFGPDGWTETHENLETQGTWGRNNSVNYHITCFMRLMVGHWAQMPDGSPFFMPTGSWSQYGEHKSGNRGDCRKGAHGNALKKAAALGLGIGASAFRGTMDEDMAGEQPPVEGPRSQPPAATPQQQHEMNRAADWGVPKQMKSTKQGGCCLCADRISPGEFIIFPVRHPYSGKKAAAHARCFDREFPHEPVERPETAPKAEPEPSTPGPGAEAADGQTGDQGGPYGGQGDPDPDDDLPF